MALDMTSFILGQKSAGGGGGGGDITTQALTVTANGTYPAPSGKAYTPVTVNVPIPEPVLQSKTAIQNGTVIPDSGYDGLSSVVVNVPQLDTSDATATAANIMSGLTAYVDGVKITGTAAASVSGTNLIIPEGLVTVNA